MAENQNTEPTTFTDEEGDTFRAVPGEYQGQPTISLEVVDSDDTDNFGVLFFTKDADKIIHLILLARNVQREAGASV